MGELMEPGCPRQRPFSQRKALEFCPLPSLSHRTRPRFAGSPGLLPFRQRAPLPRPRAGLVSQPWATRRKSWCVGPGSQSLEPRDGPGLPGALQPRGETAASHPHRQLANGDVGPVEQTMKRWLPPAGVNSYAVGRALMGPTPPVAAQLFSDTWLEVARVAFSLMPGCRMSRKHNRPASGVKPPENSRARFPRAGGG